MLGKCFRLYMVAFSNSDIKKVAQKSKRPFSFRTQTRLSPGYIFEMKGIAQTVTWVHHSTAEMKVIAQTVTWCPIAFLTYKKMTWTWPGCPIISSVKRVVETVTKLPLKVIDMKELDCHLGAPQYFLT